MKIQEIRDTDLFSLSFRRNASKGCQFSNPKEWEQQSKNSKMKERGTNEHVTQVMRRKELEGKELEKHKRKYNE